MQIFCLIKLVSDWTYVLSGTPCSKRGKCFFAATLRDHRLPFQNCSSQRPRRYGFFSPIGIALKLNQLYNQLYEISRCGQSGEVIYQLARGCSLLGLPSVASNACPVVQISPSKWQCGELQMYSEGSIPQNSLSNF